MSNYCITFRLANKTVGGKTYQNRYDLLVSNAITQGKGFWDEPTSFFFVESALDTNAYAAKVCKGLSAADDLVIVFDPSDMSACYFGVVEHLEVLVFLPLLKKAP